MRLVHLAIVATLAWGSVLTSMGRAADQLNLVIGSSASSGIPISTADLRTFAQTGTAPTALQSILSLMPPETQAKLRTALQANYPVDVADLEQRAKSENGVQVLNSLASATLRPGPQGVSDLETAILKSAANPQGFNLIDFIEAYPEPVLNLDINQIEALMQANESLVAKAAQRVEGNGVNPPNPPNGATPTPSPNP